MSFNKKLIFIAFVGIMLAIFWQEINSNYLQNREEYRYGMIQTADEASYIAPPTNFINKGIWADNSDGITRFYQRPPGYGLLFLVCKLLLGTHALLGLKILQLLAYFLSIIILGKITLQLLSKEKIALTATLIFAILPMFSGFVYYTLTEGITPFLTLWSLFSYLQLDKTQKPTSYLISSALLILVRPQMIALPLLLMAYQLIKNPGKQSIFFLLSFVPFILWQIRTYSISTEIPDLHPIYSTKNNTLFRPGHEKMTELFRIWEVDGEKFHTAIALLKNENTENALQHVPQEIRLKVSPIFNEYSQLLTSKLSVESSEYLRQETKFIAHIKNTILEVKKDNKFLNHFNTPLKSAFYLLTKSHMNLFVFQDPWRGNILVELLRILSVLLINLGFIAALTILLRRKFDHFTVIASFLLLTFFYLIYFQRLNEERYLTPLLPLLLICLMHEVNRIFETFRNRFFKSQKEI